MNANFHFVILRCSLIMYSFLFTYVTQTTSRTYLKEIGQFQALLLPCHQIARAYHIFKDCKLQKIDAVPQLTGGQKVYTIKKDNDSICSSLS